MRDRFGLSSQLRYRMAYTPPLGDELEPTLETYTPPSGDALVLDLTPAVSVVFPPITLIGWEIRKRIGPASTALLRPGIYQMRQTKKGKVPIRMKFYVPTNPRTAPQQAQRVKWYDAVNAWGALTDEQKAVYNSEGRKRRQRGYDYFRSLHLKGLI